MCLSCTTSQVDVKSDYAFPALPDPSGEVYPAVFVDEQTVKKVTEAEEEYTAVILSKTYWKKLVSYLFDVETLRILYDTQK